MQRGEVCFAATLAAIERCSCRRATPRPDRIGSVVVAAIARTTRGLVSELELTAAENGLPSY